jgi:hypothetical protein
VKPGPGGNINVKIGVVHSMKIPEETDFMKEKVLGIYGKVKERYGNYSGNHGGYLEIVEKSPALRLCAQG